MRLPRSSARRGSSREPAGGGTPASGQPVRRGVCRAGCHGVAEGAALAAVGPAGQLVVRQDQIEPRHLRARARARAARPRPDRAAPGRLALVGLGPGSADWRTAEASALLDDADDWVGYAGYLDLIPLPPWRQVIRAFALGEEEARVRRWIWPQAAARWR